jgi:regulator of protease activity HflC (stomatin/prohibitin superfamily)
MTSDKSKTAVSGETEKQKKTVKQRLKDFWNKHLFHFATGLLIIILFFAVFWDQMVISIYPGEQALRWTRFGGTQLDESYSEGTCIIWPWNKMYRYNTRVQSNSDTLRILTAKGLSIEVEYFSRFYIKKDSVARLHQTLGPDYVNTYIIPEIVSASLSIIGNYTPEELYKISTLVVQSTIKYYLNKQLYVRDIILEDYMIKRISLPRLVAESIEKKIVAEQLNYEFDYRLNIEEKKKKQRVIEAEGIREFETISNIPILKWKGLEVTSEFANSENSKIILMGTSDKDLPLLLNTETK